MSYNVDPDPEVICYQCGDHLPYEQARVDDRTFSVPVFFCPDSERKDCLTRYLLNSFTREYGSLQTSLKELLK